MQLHRRGKILGSRCGKLLVTEDRKAMFEEGSAGEGFGRDIGEVVGGRVFDQENGFAFLCVSDHGVLGRYPFRFSGDTLAAGTVDQDSGICED